MKNYFRRSFEFTPEVEIFSALFKRSQQPLDEKILI